MKTFIIPLIISASMLLTGWAHASPLHHYRAAQRALASKNQGEYTTHMKAMGDYLIKPIVEYQYLQARFDSLDNKTIEDFITQNSDIYVSNALKKKWLRRLAKQNEWSRFEAHYDDAVNSTELECHHLNQHMRSQGISAETDARIRELWLTPHGRPGSCTSVFMRWKQAGKMSDDLFWERVNLTLFKKKEKRARSLLTTYLPTTEHHWNEPLLAVHKNPVDALSNPSFSLTQESGARLILYGLEEIARTDPDEAEAVWKTLLKKSSALQKYQADVDAVIGFRAAINHHPRATQWLRRAPSGREKVRVWGLRAALREGEWKHVLRFFDKLSVEEKKSPDWRYWQARALEKTNKKSRAQKIYKEIAKEREYYSFLAADKINAQYQMNHHAVKASTKALAKARPFKIAKELAKIGELNAMRQQWQWAIRKLNDKDMLAAAKLAQQWEFTDRAIFTVARAKHYDDLELRFPVLYKRDVTRESRSKQLPPAYVYGIMRQESAFMADVRSPAGAVGLMQIMPGTGRLIARKQKNGKFRTKDLVEPAINVEMGTYYLRNMLDRFGNNYAMATAAYNAGPRRPPEWQARHALDADIWIESIPFNETRNYVKKVLLYTAIYGEQLGHKHQPLSKLLATVPGKN